MATEAPPPRGEGEAPEDGEPEPEPVFTLTLSVKSVTPLVQPPTVPEEPEEGAEPPVEVTPPQPAVCHVAFPGESDPIESSSPVEPEADGSYFFNLERTFERVPGVDLLNQLVNEPLVVTIKVGDMELARCEVDLFPFTKGALRVGSALIETEENDDANASETRKDPSGEATEDEEDRNHHSKRHEFLPLVPIPFPVASPEGEENPEEPLPINPLLPAASIDVSITASFAFVAVDDAARGRVLTVIPHEIQNTPPSLSAFEDVNAYPFTWGFGVPLPGGIPNAVVEGGRLARRPVGDTGTSGNEGDEETRMETYITWRVDSSEFEDPDQTPNQVSKKFWLPANSVDQLREQLKGRGKTLGVEVARFPQTDPTTTPDPVFQNYHATSDVSLNELTDPGSVACAPQRAFLKAPLYGHKSCLPKPPEPPDGAKAFGDEPAVPPGSVAWAAATEPARVTFTLLMSESLLPPWAPPPPTETTVAELLPTREVVVKHEDPPEVVAAREFRAEVTRAATSLAEEFASMFTGVPADTEPNASSTRRKKLVFELNRSGKYHDMKERLKDAAGLIVKSRFFQKSTIAPDDANEIDAKYDDLYVHLVEEMHKALAGFGIGEDRTSAETDEVDAHEKLVKLASRQKQKALADEYEINSLFLDAEKWHQERLLLTEKQDSLVWCDYGGFLARRGRFGASEEAFKEALVVDGTCVNALNALTALMLRDEEFSRAEVYGQAVVTNVSPGDDVAWSLLACTYAHLERDMEQTNCAFKARSITATAMTNLMGASPRLRMSREEQEKTESELARLVGPPAHVKAALLCLDLSLHKEALVMLSLGLQDPDTHHDAGGLRDDERLVLKLCAARSALIESSFERDKFQQTQTHDDELTETQKTSTDVAFGHCMAALSIDSTDPRPFELLGDLHLVDRRHGEAEEAYAHAMAVSGTFGKPPASLKLFLSLGNVLLKNEKCADARATFAAGCEMIPGCASTWIGYGVSLLREGDLDSAESALAEANALDSSNANAWGWLCVVSLSAKRIDDAERAVASAFKNGLRDPDLLSEIAQLFLENGGWKHSEASARRSLKFGGGIDTRLCLGRASRERGDPDGAAVELKFALALALDYSSKQSPSYENNVEKNVEACIPLLLAELALAYDELGDSRKAEECRRDLRVMEREQ